MAKFESKFQTASMSPGFLLWKVANLHQRLQKKVLEPLELTPTQFAILTCYLFLSRRSDLVAQTDICKHAGIDKMLVSDITKTLVKKCYLKSSKNKDDRRSFNIEVTDEGARVCNKALKIIEELDTRFFGRTKNPKDLLKIMEELADTKLD